MPARKPTALIDWHQTRTDREAREAMDAMLLPKTQISKRPPASLKGHAVASAIWKQLIELYAEVEGTIITAFDENLLASFCLAQEELVELFQMRKDVKALWTEHTKALSSIKPKPDAMKDYFNALNQASALLQRYQGFDARIDGKRKMIFIFAQSLFLTPRSRSGVAPKEKEPEQPQDDMEKLLSD